MKSMFLICLSIFIYKLNIYSQTTDLQNVTIFEIEAPQLDTIKSIWVYLPKSYKTSKKSYPVIYMHDAQNLFDEKTSYAGEWKIDEYLDSIDGQEAIIIGIEHGNEKRIDELTPHANEKYGGGHGNAYLAFIKNTLIPYVNVTYRTLKGPENTLIFGSSLGGLISFYAAIKYPETFGKAGVFSPSFWFSDKIFDFAEMNSINAQTKFFFLIGTDEDENAVENQNKMVGVLIDKGVQNDHIVNRIIEGGKHNETFWSKYFPEAYQWLIK